MRAALKRHEMDLAGRKAQLLVDAEKQRKQICDGFGPFKPLARGIDLGLKVSHYAKTFVGIYRALRGGA